ncbi:MAG: DinB family protein [Acidobacteriota bacterium]
MTAQPQRTLLVVLEDGRADVLAAIQGLSDDVAATKPAPDRWSPLECMEHIVVVEDRFLGWIATGSDTPPPLDEEKGARLFGMATDRSFKAQAPEAVIPTGKFATVAEAMEAFNGARDRTVQIARARGAELMGVGVKHPRFGEMNAADLVHLIAGHACRHAAQIRECVRT